MVWIVLSVSVCQGPSPTPKRKQIASIYDKFGYVLSVQLDFPCQKMCPT